MKNADINQQLTFFNTPISYEKLFVNYSISITDIWYHLKEQIVTFKKLKIIENYSIIDKANLTLKSIIMLTQERTKAIYFWIITNV